MLTLPPMHPVNACIQRAIKSKSTTSITNLEYIAKNFPDYVKPVEIIHPFIKAPWWEPPHTIISDDKKVAKSIHNMTSHNQNDIVLYTDGSGFKGGIAAAVHCEHLEEPAQNYLGKESDINVYAAEVTAIKMAADICMTLVTNETQRCTIYTDSQAAIITTVKPRRQSGQSIVSATIDSLEHLKAEHPNVEVTITWIPGHRDIEGNDKADEAAKYAAENPTTVINTNPTPLK